MTYTLIHPYTLHHSWLLPMFSIYRDIVGKKARTLIEIINKARRSVAAYLTSELAQC